MRDSKFTFFISGKKDNDRLALNYLEGIDKDCRYMFFKLPYVLPYQRFDGIRRFQYAARYRPFSDSTVRQKTCILDLSEWVEHSGEEYLEIFLKFLHDYHGFFDFDYLITVSDFSKQDVRPLVLLASQYLSDGKIYEDRTLSDWRVLQGVLSGQYPISESVSEMAARILVDNQIEGLAQAETILEDLCRRFVKSKKGGKITETDLLNRPDALRNSIFNLFYQNEVEQWMTQLSSGRGGGGKEKPKMTEAAIK